MALFSIPFVSSPFRHSKCHITCRLSDTLATQQSSECIRSCYCLPPGCHNLNYLSLAYLWAMYLTAVYIKKPLLMCRIRKPATVLYCMVTSRPHSPPQSKLLLFYNRIAYCRERSCQSVWESVAHTTKENMCEILWLGLKHHHNKKEVCLPARFCTCQKGSPYPHRAGTSPG